MSPADPRLAPLRALATSYAAKEPVRSVAVVGNAPLEPADWRAAEIDAADVVVRVNSFVLDRPGEPASQGRRTTMVLFSRLVPATPDFFAGYADRLYVLLEPMRIYGRKEVWPGSWPVDLGYAVARNDAVGIPLNEEIARAGGFDWRAERLAPTTGLTGVWLALRLFPGADVAVTGMSFLDAPDQTEWRHQWGDAIGVGPEHRIAAESRVLRSWVDAGLVRSLPLGGDR